MKDIYAQIRKKALEIAAHFPQPSFYKDFLAENAISLETYQTNPLISNIRLYVEENLEDDFGHGLKHATDVTLDAGALTLIEGQIHNDDDVFLNRRMILAQCAGLLHDIKRKMSNHALASAKASREILSGYSLRKDEIEDIFQAIRNHEAFKTPFELNSVEGKIISDCLYDADKFRWGPDNFTDTVWHMVSFFNAPIEVFIAGYEKGIDGIIKIKNTFRSDSGKKYGPEFIDIGLAIGDELYRYIKNKFG